MPIFLQPVNYDSDFHTLRHAPVILNDLALASAEDRAKVADMVTTRYNGDMVTLLPSCRCGALKGAYSKGEKGKEVICSQCLEPVKSSGDDDIETALWMRRPNVHGEQVAPFISLVTLAMLKARFKQNGFNIIQWLLDPDYRPAVKQPEVIAKIIHKGIPRGYNNFIYNFDEIMEILFSFREFAVKRGQVDELQEFLKTNRHLLFSNHLPAPNKALLIIERTHLGVYIDPNIIDGVDAIKMMVSIDKDFYDRTARARENRTAKALLKLSDFYVNYIKTTLNPKPGLPRRHLYGSRNNMSFRAVISSLTDTHNYDEVHLPWCIGLTTFEPYLKNKLLKLGYSPNEASGLIYGHIYKYNALLDRLLKEIVAESPEQAITILLERN